MEQRVYVIVPARGKENLVGRTLVALFDQHSRPSRVVVVNDGSTNRTSEIASASGTEAVKEPDSG